MLQRIQSIFLALASVSGIALFFLPFTSVNNPIKNSALFKDAVYNIQDHTGMLVLFAIATLTVSASIFLFKNRSLQKKVCLTAIILNILGIIFSIVFFMQNTVDLGSVKPKDELGLAFPILFIIFGFLAIRYINKDDKLVKSMDRLR